MGRIPSYAVEPAGVPLQLPRIRLLRLLPRAITRHLESLRLKLDCDASLISVQNLHRATPTWRALPIRRLVGGYRVTNMHIREPEGLSVRQQSAQLAATYFLEGCLPRHHAQIPLLYKLPRKRCILGKKQIFVPIATPKKLRRVRSDN